MSYQNVSYYDANKMVPRNREPRPSNAQVESNYINLPPSKSKQEPNGTVSIAQRPLLPPRKKEL